MVSKTMVKVFLLLACNSMHLVYVSFLSPFSSCIEEIMT